MIEKIDKKKLKSYLESVFGKSITVLNVGKLGSGVLGTGFLLEFERKVKGKRTIKYKKVLKSLFTQNLGKDHFSDRVQSLLLAHSTYNKIPGHVKSRDVCIVTGDDLVSIGGTEEAFILMDEAKGTDYFQELLRIKDADFMGDEDKKKVLLLSDTLVKLHSKNAKSKSMSQADSLYRRKIRDTIGGGESLMGVFDMYPADAIPHKTAAKMVALTTRFWIRSRDMSHRLCQVHGDFHPGNIWFKGERLTLLDRARGEWGEAADDIAAFLINPIMLSVAKQGRFQGALKDLFDLFWNDYFSRTKDREMRRLLAPYFAFRVSVVCNPLFYNDDFFGGRDKAERTRRLLFNLALNALKDDEFDPSKMDQYLKKAI